MILSDAMLWRMIWKEYRAQRGFWLVISGFAIVLMLLFLGPVDQQEVRFQAPWIIAMSLPAVYMLGCAAVLFASEREDGTIEMLQIMAARTNRVFLGKVSFCLVSTLAMCTFLLGVALILTWGIRFKLPAFEIDNLQHELLHQAQGTARIAIQIFAWGVLFSAICRKGLTAVCLTAVIPLVIAIITMNIASYFMQPGLSDRNNEAIIWYSGIALVLPLVALSYARTRRTIAGRTRDWSLPRLDWRSRSTVIGLDRLAAVKETSPMWQRTMKRLIWLELKQALTIGHVLWIAGLLFFVWFPLEGNDPKTQVVRGIFGMLLSSLLIGVWTFQAEGARRTRFLADHGLSPHVVWLSKQLVWGMLTVAVTAPCVLAISVANHRYVQWYALQYQASVSSLFHDDVPGSSAITFAVILAGLGYAAGQFASMLIARGVTASFVGFVLLVMLVPWTWLVIELRIPLSISVTPLFLILLATTLGWSRHWMLEQATARSWLRLAGLLGLSIVLVWAGVGAFRVYEVPRPDFVDAIAPLREAHGAPITPEEAETATLYRRALTDLKWQGKGTEYLPTSGQQSAIHGWKHATEFERRMLAENQNALRQGLAASERPTCAINDPLRPKSEMEHDFSFSFLNGYRLATLMLLSARKLEGQGQLDEALNRYVAVLRMARHAASRGTMHHWIMGLQFESLVSTWIPVWVAHPDQTPGRIETGRRRIGQETDQFPPLRDAVLTEQYMTRRAVRNDWPLVAPQRIQDGDTTTRTVLKVFDRCCPWELARGLRVLDLVGAAQLHCLDVFDQALVEPSGLKMEQWAEIAGAVPETNKTLRPALNRTYQAHSGNHLGFGPGNFFEPQLSATTLQERIPWNWVKTTFPLNMELHQADLQQIWIMREHESSMRTRLSQLK